MELTQEQKEVVCSEAKNLIVNAFAGTGKTSTLVAFAKARPQKRFIYLAFNRAIKEDAAKKFPSNVRCVTTHGLAYGKYGAQYRHKLGTPRAFHLGSAMGLDRKKAGFVLETVTEFLCSSAASISELHAPVIASARNAPVMLDIVQCAQKAWELMQDEQSPVPMPHDGYLKLYQLSNPKIQCDYILFDEAQDANPVTLAIIREQTCNKVFVGDRHQAIYQFRGAVNALSAIEADESLDLTCSFRFGRGIAAIATALLQHFCGAKKPVQGLGPFPETVFWVNRNAPHAVIARTNGALFSHAIQLVLSKTPFGYAGGIAGYRLDQILDVFYLYAEEHSKIKEPFIASFDTYGKMQSYAQELDDKELLSLISVVEEYGYRIPELVQRIKREAIEPLTGREVVLSTAHKSKGLEWENVILLNDFSDLEPKEDEMGNVVMPDEEEINILYVALTRALHRIVLPQPLVEWLSANGYGWILESKPQSSTSNDLPQSQEQIEERQHHEGGGQEPWASLAPMQELSEAQSNREKIGYLLLRATEELAFYLNTLPENHWKAFEQQKNGFFTKEYILKALTAGRNEFGKFDL